MTGFVQNLY